MKGYIMNDTSQLSKLDQIIKNNTVNAPTAAQKAASAPAVSNTGSNSEMTITNMLVEIVQHLQSIDEEKDMIGEVVVRLKKEHEIEPKVARAAAKIMHKADEQKNNEFRDAVENLLRIVAKNKK